jgi:hypothetical protein
VGGHIFPCKSGHLTCKSVLFFFDLMSRLTCWSFQKIFKKKKMSSAWSVDLLYRPFDRSSRQQITRQTESGASRIRPINCVPVHIAINSRRSHGNLVLILKWTSVRQVRAASLLTAGKGGNNSAKQIKREDSSRYRATQPLVPDATCRLDCFLWLLTRERLFVRRLTFVHRPQLSTGRLCSRRLP